jgi:hypothetical protein
MCNTVIPGKWQVNYSTTVYKELRIKRTPVKNFLKNKQWTLYCICRGGEYSSYCLWLAVSRPKHVSSLFNCPSPAVCDESIAISQYRLLFGFLLLYMGPCSIWIVWQRSPPMKGELRWRGENSIFKVDHHNINGDAVDNTWRHRYETCKLNLLMRYLWMRGGRTAIGDSLQQDFLRKKTSGIQ